MVNNLAAQGSQEQLPGPVRHAAQTNDHLFTFSTENGTRLLLHALSDKILRFRYLTPGSPAEPDFSYAIPDPATELTTLPSIPTFLEFKEKDDHYPPHHGPAHLHCVERLAAHPRARPLGQYPER